MPTSRARLADVREFSEQYYTPSHATLVIAGDFTSAAAKQLVERCFGPLKHGPAVAKSSEETPPITSERRSTVEDTVKLPAVLFGWLTSPVFAPGDAEGNLTSAILGTGNSSRFYHELVYKQQIAQSVTCNNQSLALTGANATAPALDLLADLVQHPAFTAEETDRLGKARATSLLQETDQPLRLAALAQLRALYGTGQRLRLQSARHRMLSRCDHAERS
jgi:predicted Zn-dependent peptidase